MGQVASSIKTGYDHLGRKVFVSASTTVAMFAPTLASAGVTIGDVGTNVGDQSSGLTSGALRIAGFVGIVLVAISLIKGRSAKQQGESIGSYVGMFLVGALLLAIPTLITIANVSLIGSDSSSTIQGQIIQ